LFILKKNEEYLQNMFVILNIHEKYAELNFFPNPKVLLQYYTLILDFEQATIQADRVIIEFDLEIRGCFYHIISKHESTEKYKIT